MPTVPAGASPAGRSYLAAVAAATPGWERVDATLSSEGGITHRNDLRDQIAADKIFLDRLGRIRFPASVRPTAARLIAAVRAYVHFIQTAYDHHGYLAQHLPEDRRLNVDRADASAALRQVLGLPQSTCRFNRP